MKPPRVAQTMLKLEMTSVGMIVGCQQPYLDRTVLSSGTMSVIESSRLRKERLGNRAASVSFERTAWRPT